jgi:glycerophosphoryl diester phosphodiesterase
MINDRIVLYDYIIHEGKMKYIAHRGFSSKAPENTIPAFELAAKEQRYFGIECDVQTTKDHQFVIFHDEDLQRMGKAKIRVRDLTYHELLSYSILKGNGIQKYVDLKIPLLTDYLEICSFHNKTAVIEVKFVHDITLLTELINLIDNYPSLSVIIISFNMSYLKYLRAITHIELQYLSDDISDVEIYDARVNQLNLSLHKDSIHKNLVLKLKKEGFSIAVYTVNDAKDALKFEKLGIDYLTTDKL